MSLHKCQWGPPRLRIRKIGHVHDRGLPISLFHILMHFWTSPSVHRFYLGLVYRSFLSSHVASFHMSLSFSSFRSHSLSHASVSNPIHTHIPFLLTFDSLHSRILTRWPSLGCYLNVSCTLMITPHTPPSILIVPYSTLVLSMFQYSCA